MYCDWQCYGYDGPDNVNALEKVKSYFWTKEKEQPIMEKEYIVIYLPEEVVQEMEVFRI